MNIFTHPPWNDLLYLFLLHIILKIICYFIPEWKIDSYVKRFITGFTLGINPLTEMTTQHIRLMCVYFLIENYLARISYYFEIIYLTIFKLICFKEFNYGRFNNIPVTSWRSVSLMKKNKYHVKTSHRNWYLRLYRAHLATTGNETHTFYSGVSHRLHWEMWIQLNTIVTTEAP